MFAPRTVAMATTCALLGAMQYGWNLRTLSLLAAAGLLQLAATDLRRALLVFTLFAANLAFAYSYNVGDAHVFYLPSHLIVALLVAPVLAAVGEKKRRVAAAT